MHEWKKSLVFVLQLEQDAVGYKFFMLFMLPRLWQRVDGEVGKKARADSRRTMQQGRKKKM